MRTLLWSDKEVTFKLQQKPLWVLHRIPVGVTNVAQLVQYVRFPFATRYQPLRTLHGRNCKRITGQGNSPLKAQLYGVQASKQAEKDVW